MYQGMGLIVRKCGMTSLFRGKGVRLPISVLQVDQTCQVTQLKTLECDGYTAVQVGSGQVKNSRLNKAQKGHFQKAGVQGLRSLKEFRVLPYSLSGYELAQSFDASFFSIGQKVDVVGLTKGKGFSGCIKRHHFSSQRASHGNSLSHNTPGSIGQCQDPGRVFKGKKMAGHLGHVRRTIKNLEIVDIDLDRNLLLVKGAVPGFSGAELVVLPTKKKSKRVSQGGLQ